VALSTRARALTAAGHLDDAIADLDAALVLDRQRGDHASIALRLRRLGQAHQARGDTTRAVELLRQAVEEMAAADDQAGHARCLTYLAQGYLAAGQPDRAVDALRGGKDYLEHAGAIRHRVDAGLTAAHAYQQLGDTAAARAVCEELLFLLEGQSGSRAERRCADVRAMQEQLG
jgi:tetratricopeptide (TPR) repeat protein